MKSYIIPTVEQKLDNIILHTGTNNLKIIGTPKEIQAYKTDTNSGFISGIVPRTDKFNEKASKVNSILRHKCNVRNIYFCLVLYIINIYLPDSIVTETVWI